MDYFQVLLDIHREVQRKKNNILFRIVNCQLHYITLDFIKFVPKSNGNPDSFIWSRSIILDLNCIRNFQYHTLSKSDSREGCRVVILYFKKGNTNKVFHNIFSKGLCDKDRYYTILDTISQRNLAGNKIYLHCSCPRQ